MAANAISTDVPVLDDTQQRLLFKICSLLDRWLVVRGTGSPVAAVTPAFSGQLYQDLSTRLYWRSNGTSASDWVLA